MIHPINKNTSNMHSTKQYPCKIGSSEALIAMNELSSGAFKLFVYYNCKSNTWTFMDSDIALTLKITQKRVVELRKELVDKGYLWVIKTPHHIINYIGKKMVTKVNK